jgi:hypothetical protein
MIWSGVLQLFSWEFHIGRVYCCRYSLLADMSDLFYGGGPVACCGFETKVEFGWLLRAWGNHSASGQSYILNETYLECPEMVYLFPCIGFEYHVIPRRAPVLF